MIKIQFVLISVLLWGFRESNGVDYRFSFDDARLRQKRSENYDFGQNFGGVWRNLYAGMKVAAYGEEEFERHALNLKKPCNVSAECAIAFSLCDKTHKVCKCRMGFVAGKNGLCYAVQKDDRFVCPRWNRSDPALNRTVACLVTGTSSSPNETPAFRDSCLGGGSAKTAAPVGPSGEHFCFLHHQAQLGSRIFSGHCCPRPPRRPGSTDDIRLTCPQGDPVPGRRCDSAPNFVGSTVVRSNRDRQGSLCDQSRLETCLSMHWDDGKTILMKSVCCPVPCAPAPDSFVFRGRCYQNKFLGNICKIDQQCSNEYGEHCVKNGTDGLSSCQLTEPHLAPKFGPA